jgi:hypothetical protein
MKTSFLTKNKLQSNILKNKILSFNFSTNTKNPYDRIVQLEKDTKIKQELKHSLFVRNKKNLLKKI